MYSSLRSLLSAKEPRSGPSIEVLEQRIAPATFTVTTIADSGAGSLRQAILAANDTAAADVIHFRLTGEEGPLVIQPHSALPQIIFPLTIDGSSQSGASKNTAEVGTNAVVRVVLDGSLAGFTSGLTVAGPASGGSKITGLAIVNFFGAGIDLQSDGNVVVGNFIGVARDGVTAQGNGGAGVLVSGGKDEVIGTAAPEDRNLISANGHQSLSGGVEFSAGSGQVIGNLIGTNAAGTAALGNADHGVGLAGVTAATIAQNVISGNNYGGIYAFNTTATTIVNNLIGVDASGQFPLGNKGGGVALDSGTTTTRIVGNIIADNEGDGVGIFGPSTTANSVLENQIGVNKFGAAMPNDLHGVEIGNGANLNIIGSSFQGNYIANHYASFDDGTVAAGILIHGASTNGNTIAANTIANNGIGVWINDAAGNTVGSATIGDGNEIIGNGTGIAIEHPHATGNKVIGNRIGVYYDSETGLYALPNGTGVRILDAATNTIGGTAQGEGNLIAGNTGDGISIEQQDQIFGLGQFDYFPTSPAPTPPTVTEATFAAGQVGEGLPFTSFFTSGQTISLLFTGAFEPGSAQVYFKLWGLNTKLTGSQVESLTFDGVAQNVGEFENNPVGPGTEQYYFFNVDPALLTDGTLDIKLKLGTLPAGQKVGIDYSELRIIHESSNEILGNTIGGVGDSTGENSLTNGGDGIHLVNTSRVYIGDGTEAGKNFIGGNGGAGIHLQGTVETRVAGNVIGSTSTARDHVTNFDGVLVEGGFLNFIGAGGSNVISGNLRDGVRMTAGAGSNSVTGNFIGTSADGLAARPNGGNGVSVLDGSSYNFIGLSGEHDSNVISGNRGAGVVIGGENTFGNYVRDNLIGTDATGAVGLPNGGEGVRIEQLASGNHIGEGGGGNTISGNSSHGVSILNANDNEVAGNRIGTTSDGLHALGNGGAGVFVTGDSNVIDFNTISGNTGAGVNLSGTGVIVREIALPPIFAEFNVVRGNLIGVDANADVSNPLPNSDGVLITNGASDNLVGGTHAFDGNHIAYNEGTVIVPRGSIITHAGQGDGVRVESGSERNAILGNSIHDNTGLGINLDGGNNDQIAPTLTAALIKHGTMIFKGSFTSTPNTTFRIEMFVAEGINDELPDHEGQTLLGFFEVTTDADGFVSYRKTLPTAVPAGTFITATATALDASLNPTDTSEFADAIKAVPTISVTGGAVVEGDSGDKSLSFTISLGATPEAGAASVLYSTGDFSDDARSATAEVDYDAVTDSILGIQVASPLSDPLTRQVSIAIHGDTAFEARERFKVLLSGPVGVGFDDGEDEGVGTIIDDDQHTFAVGAATGSKVQIFNSVDGSLLREFTAFEPRYRGGARVATGDVTGDGINDIIVGTGTGGSGRVRVFDGTDTSANPTPLFELRPFGSSYRGAVNVAVGDVNGDGRAELIVSTGTGSAAEVRVVDLAGAGSPVLLTKFKAFPKVTNGVRVATGDLDGDGLADIIATNGLTSEVRTFHGDGAAFAGAIGKFNAFGKLPRGGVFATAGDLDGDGRDDLVFSAAAGSSEVRSFLTTVFTASPVRTFNAFSILAGVRLAITDVNSDGIADIVAAQGPGRATAVSLFNGSNGAELLKIDGVPTGGVFVG